MKKSKYLVLSAAAVLAVGCGGGKMPKIEDEVAVTTALKIVEKEAESFMTVPALQSDYPDDAEGQIAAWKEWEAPKKYVSVTATDTTHVVRHNPGDAFYDNTRTATRTVKYDLENRHIQYIYDADFYEDAAGFYHPGVLHAQYDYIYSSGGGLWCCSDVNGERYKTKADWGWIVDEEGEYDPDGYKVIGTKEEADAWLKYAYVFATILNKTYPDLFVAPIPSAQHYMCGFDDMMDYFINWGDGADVDTVTDFGWYGLMHEDFGSNDDVYYTYEFEPAMMNNLWYGPDSDDPAGYYVYDPDEGEMVLVPTAITFDTFAQFVYNSLNAKALYEKDFEKGEDFGNDSYAKVDYFSDDKEKNLAGEVAYRLDYKKEATVTETLPAWSYGIDYSFNYADSYLTKSDTKYYLNEQYLNSKGEKTEYYNEQSATKSVNISYDKPNFKDVDLTDYTAYNYIPDII